MLVLTPAAPAHAEQAATVLATALRDDPVMNRFVSGDAAERQVRLTQLFGVFIRSALRHGAVDLAREQGDPTVLGVAVWSAPGRHRHRLADLRSYWRAFGPRGLRPALALDRIMHAARPAAPHWYLAAIGVDPHGHGRGIGSALLENRLRTLDHTGPHAAYLEASTPRSAALYARYGFDSTGRLAGFPAPAEPIAMWRPARAA